MIDTKELRRLAQAATPGPWKIIPVGDEVKCFAVSDINFLSVLTVVNEGDTSFGAVYLDGDAKFIAAANPATGTELLDRLEAAEKERDALRAENEALATNLRGKHSITGATYAHLIAERDALLAKIERMEKQEPVGLALLCVRCSTPFDGEHYCPACGHHTATEEAVYAIHGAQPAPSEGSITAGILSGQFDSHDAERIARAEAKRARKAAKRRGG